MRMSAAAKGRRIVKVGGASVWPGLQNGQGRRSCEAGCNVLENMKVSLGFYSLCAEEHVCVTWRMLERTEYLFEPQNSCVRGFVYPSLSVSICLESNPDFNNIAGSSEA